MKRKWLIRATGALIVLNLVTVPSFAQASIPVIDNVSELKTELNKELSAKETQLLLQETPNDVLEEFVTEKMDKAVMVIADEDVSAEMRKNPDGTLYSIRKFDLGDGCELTVELTDKGVSNKIIPLSTSALATSGSSDLWKGYGARTFTANATVDFTIGKADMSLTNKYILSADGIDENGGSATCSLTQLPGTISKGTPVTSDASARTPGASDVNMHCDFTINYSNSNGTKVISKYRLSSTVGFVAIDKTNKQIKVRQSWGLNKIS